VVNKAGIVNDRGEADDAAFGEVIAPRSPEVQTIARAMRALVYDALPQTVEVVWARQGSVGWGTGRRKFTEQFAYLMPFAKHATLGFYHGGELDDPTGLLRSGGKQVSGSLSMRSLRLSSLDDVSRPELLALVTAAIRHLVARACALPEPVFDGDPVRVSGDRRARSARTHTPSKMP
jgi:hypothetical protein